MMLQRLRSKTANIALLFKVIFASIFEKAWG